LALPKGFVWVIKKVWVIGYLGDDDDDLGRSQIKYFTHVDKLGVITLSQVVQYRRIVQEGQVGHVLCLLVLWRIHLVDLILLESFALREKIINFHKKISRSNF